MPHGEARIRPCARSFTSAGETEEMHVFVKPISGMRPARSQLLALRPTNAEVTGNPLQLAFTHRV